MKYLEMQFLLVIIKEASNFISKIFQHITVDNSAKEMIQKLIPDESCSEYLESFAKPYWMQLHLKVASRMPDTVWQNIINIIQHSGGEASPF